MSKPSQRNAQLRRQCPEIEFEHHRLPALGYEPVGEVGFIRCIAHGYPTPLARWHSHPEYELHLIVATSGNAFIGDWMGPFEPGQLVLCGPDLPHNWVSLEMPDGGVACRDLAIQFLPAPIFEAAQKIPELAEATGMLERARHGIEFFGFSDAAERHWAQIKAAQGLKRFGLFCDFLADLARCTDCRTLSSMQFDAELNGEPISDLVNRIAANPAEPVSVTTMAAELGMNTGRFARLFRRATGNSFVGYVTQMRVNKACRLLMETDSYVTSICYEAGFNNVANFNRHFLEIKGITPSEFRRTRNQRFPNI